MRLLNNKQLRWRVWELKPSDWMMRAVGWLLQNPYARDSQMAVSLLEGLYDLYELQHTHEVIRRVHPCLPWRPLDELASLVMNNLDDFGQAAGWAREAVGWIATYRHEGGVGSEALDTLEGLLQLVADVPAEHPLHAG